MITYIHVGYPKAGSTTLQKRLFALHPEIINLGLYPTNNIGNSVDGPNLDEICRKVPYLYDPRIAELYRRLSRTSGLEFDQSAVRALWEGIAQDYVLAQPGFPQATTVLSHESLTSGRFSNPEVVEKARRVRQVFGQSKVLLMIRFQPSMLVSLYRDHPFDPRTLEYRKRPVTFPEWLEIDLNREWLSLSHTLLFDTMTRVYEALFGSENLLVLPLEMLRHDLQRAAQYLSDFLNIDACKTFELLNREPENTGISVSGNSYRMTRARIAPLLKWLHPFKTPLKRLDSYLFSQFKKRGTTASIVIPDKYKEKLAALYSQENARLSKRRGLSLKELGYDI